VVSFTQVLHCAHSCGLGYTRGRNEENNRGILIMSGETFSMTIDTDFHSHIAPSSAEQMVEAAKEKGMRVLGISEHIFQMKEARPSLPHMPLEGALYAFAEYAETVRIAAQQGRFDAQLGLEVDFIPGKNEQIQAFLRRGD